MWIINGKDAKRPLKCSKTWATHCCYFLLLLFLFWFFYFFFCHCVINMDFKESSQSSIWYAVWSITSFECHCKNRNTSWKRTHDRNFRFVREVCREKQQFYVEKIQPQHTQVRMKGCNEKKKRHLCALHMAKIVPAGSINILFFKHNDMLTAEGCKYSMCLYYTDTSPCLAVWLCLLMNYDWRWVKCIAI